MKAYYTGSGQVTGTFEVPVIQQESEVSEPSKFLHTSGLLLND